MEKWDEMIIKTEFTRNMISGLISKILKKKIGYNVGIQINEIDVANKSDKLHVHLSVDAEISVHDLEELLKNANVI